MSRRQNSRSRRSRPSRSRICLALLAIVLWGTPVRLTEVIAGEVQRLGSVKQEVHAADGVDRRRRPDPQIAAQQWRGTLTRQLGKLVVRPAARTLHRDARSRAHRSTRRSARTSGRSARGTLRSCAPDRAERSPLITGHRGRSAGRNASGKRPEGARIPTGWCVRIVAVIAARREAGGPQSRTLVPGPAVELGTTEHRGELVPQRRGDASSGASTSHGHNYRVQLPLTNTTSLSGDTGGRGLATGRRRRGTCATPRSSARCTSIRWGRQIPTAPRGRTARSRRRSGERPARCERARRAAARSICSWSRARRRSPCGAGPGLAIWAKQNCAAGSPSSQRPARYTAGWKSWSACRTG